MSKMRPITRMLRTHPKKFTQYDAYLNSIKKKKSFRFNLTQQECNLAPNFRSVHEIPQNDIPDYMLMTPMYMVLVTVIISICKRDNPYDKKKYYY